MIIEGIDRKINTLIRNLDHLLVPHLAATEPRARGFIGLNAVVITVGLSDRIRGTGIAERCSESKFVSFRQS